MCFLLLRLGVHHLIMYLCEVVTDTFLSSKTAALSHPDIAAFPTFLVRIHFLTSPVFI